MLNQQSLAALADLKQDIRVSRNVRTGTVRTTLNKFGFIVAEDGTSYFASGNTIERLLPGDVVEFTTEKNKQGNEEAVLEKLVSTELKHFYGTVHMRGQHMFVEADVPSFNRWFFVPPKMRKKAQDGDLVKVKLVKHPTHLKGKSQASIEKVIGPSSDSAIFAQYICDKWEIQTAWPKNIDKLVESALAAEVNTDGRIDLRELEFVTIDSESTRDIDDAIWAEDTGEGFNVKVAIADPWAVLKSQPELSKLALDRATSHYLHSLSIPMLPAQISQDQASLVAEQDRPAIIVSFAVDSDGVVGEFSLERGLINVKQKLSYDEVAAVLASDEAHPRRERIIAANDVAKLIGKKRRQECVTVHERPDYRYVLSDKGDIETIEKQSKNDAHRLVEELMLMTNRLAARFLEGNDAGLFISHLGFRTERLGDFKKLVSHYFEDEREVPTSVEAFVTLMNDAVQIDADVPLRSVMTRWMQPSKLSSENTGHFGLGFDHYSNISSPIRKAGDLLNHQVIHAILDGEPAPAIEDTRIEAINDMSKKARMAANQVEAKFRFSFAKKTLKKDETYSAVITHVTKRGLFVRIDELGVEGFVDLNKAQRNAESSQFDNWRLSLAIDNDFYHLDEIINVELAKIDDQKQEVQFKLA